MPASSLLLPLDALVDLSDLRRDILLTTVNASLSSSSGGADGSSPVSTGAYTLGSLALHPPRSNINDKYFRRIFDSVGA